MPFWNKELETMPTEDLRKMQMSLLKRELRTMYDSSKFVHDRLKAANLLPEDVDSLEKLKLIEPMRKTDLRDTYPDGLFVRPYDDLVRIHDDLVRIHVSSGTTGVDFISAGALTHSVKSSDISMDIKLPGGEK